MPRLTESGMAAAIANSGTANLRLLAPLDPVKYDFAPFGEGVG